jgi:hypothetical protein
MGYSQSELFVDIFVLTNIHVRPTRISNSPPASQGAGRMAV